MAPTVVPGAATAPPDAPSLIVDPATQRVLAGQVLDMASLAPHARSEILRRRGIRVGAINLAATIMRWLLWGVVEIGHARSSSAVTS